MPLLQAAFQFLYDLHIDICNISQYMALFNLSLLLSSWGFLHVLDHCNYKQMVHPSDLQWQLASKIEVVLISTAADIAVDIDIDYN